jgi:hypothetical protein
MRTPDIEILSNPFILHPSGRIGADMETITRVIAESPITAPTGVVFDGTLASLIRCYQADPDSPLKDTRYKTRLFYDSICRRLTADCGSERLADFDVRRVKRLYEGWSADGKVTMGHTCVAMLRIVLTYGTTYLRDPACRDLRLLLHDMRFKMPAPRRERLTAEQATLIRARAHKVGRHSVALAQAIQFECILRQKDVIGEWVPDSEPVASDIHHGGFKWIRGARWSEVDADLVLRHTTSKKLKDVEIDLTLAPMVMEEIDLLPTSVQARRGDGGPIIVAEKSGLPWLSGEFRRIWRLIARDCGIPDSVRNMDTRAGAITEATEAGAPMLAIKQAATHSQISMTERYARPGPKASAEVARYRVAHRNVGSSMN